MTTTRQAPPTPTPSTTGRRARLAAVGEIVAVILAFLLTAILFAPILGFPLSALALYGAVFAGWGLLRLSKMGWRHVGFAGPDDWRGTVAAALATAGGGMAVYMGVRALESLGLPPLDLSLLRDAIRGDFATYVVTMVFVVWGSAAFAEELIFRGFILDRLLSVFRGLPGTVHWAAVTQALLFGLAHAYQGVTGVLYAGTIGLLMAAVHLARGRNLWAPILAHGLMDSVAVTLLYLGVW